MSLHDLLARDLVSCSPETTVAEAARLMKKESVGALCVVHQNVPVGILTDRDIVVRCLAAGVDAAAEPVENIMTNRLQTVSINDGIKTVCDSMREGRVRRVVVTDAYGLAVGILSLGDIMDLLVDELRSIQSVLKPERHVSAAFAREEAA